MRVRLFYDRPERFSGSVDSRDEEECYTARGRRVGVWLTTEELDGPDVVSVDVELGDIAPYEVSGEADPFRTFVVPGSVTGSLAFVS
jgi:hypothetical protein